MTVDTYGKWLPMGNKALVDRLDEPTGSKTVATAGRGREKTLPDGQLEDAVCVISW